MKLSPVETLSRETRYKPSRYNIIIPTEGGSLAYNVFSNSLAKVPLENTEMINQILENPNRTSEEERYNKIKSDLIRGGFLVDYHLNEIDVLKVQNLVGRFANRALSLTIAPTLSCNFSCSYCFESKKTDTMVPETETALLHFIDQKLNSLESVNIQWFGGEPLLRIDIIERLSRGIEHLCRDHDASFNPSSIITNGYLLSVENAVRLKDANIKKVQVTLDGTADIHDQRRKLSNGSGTFWRIVDNIKKTMEILTVSIRINIDKENLHKMDDFFEFLKKENLAEKVNFYFGQVQGNTAACADIASQCLSTKEYSQSIVEIMFKAINHGIFNIQYPSLYKWGYCGADNFNSYVISPSGKIFKCWEEICADEDSSIGHLSGNEPNPLNIANAARYLSWDSFSNEHCRACSIFPVCGGGCIFNAMKSPEKKDCCTWKYNLKEMLLLKSVEIAKTKINRGVI